MLTACGHVERALGNSNEAVVAYDEAIAMLDQGDSQVRLKRSANLFMYRGLAMLSSDYDDDWKSSILSFDKAIGFRKLEQNTNLATTWSLSAAWMNRADAMGKIGGEANLKGALASLESAIELLNQLDLNSNPGFRSRMALAWMNRGNILARLTLDYLENYRNESLIACDRAVEILRHGANPEISESRRMLALALSNGSRARAQFEDLVQAENFAREALSLIQTDELEDPEMLRLMLTTRVTLCYILSEPAVADHRYIELTDLAEEGFHQAHPFITEAGDKNDKLLGQLFRCGANAYLAYLPGFLSEYLLEFLDPDVGAGHFAFSPSCHEAAVQVLWTGIGKWQDLGFGYAEDTKNRLEQIGEWQECRHHLAKIRNRYFLME